jgi:adenine-specific DNA-methyltransferase
LSTLLYTITYIFSIIPVEVLGYIYEQFLAYKQKFDYETGKTVVEADKKKKTNKDEGIYYTPKEIVSFVIQATVESEKIKEIPLLRSGNEVDGVDSVSINPNNWLNKTAVDPACGSGTFLIGWYEFLHNKYLEFYSQNSGQWIEKGFIRNAGNDKFTLTLEAKKQIVTEQIFGVDMDREAVEIAKLSLCLKVLEGENNGTIDDEKLKHGEPALPTLSENIKSGNSLLDAKQNGNMFFAENEKEYKLKPFIWSEEFEKVFESGGFDYVFANPPYISMKKFPKDQVSTIYKDFILKNYTSFTKKSDIYCCFFELALRKENGILKNGGKIGFITSSTYFAESSFAETRKLFFENNLLYYSIPRPDIFKPRAAVNASCIGIEKVEPNQKAVDIYEGERVKNKKNELVLEHNKTAKVEKSLIQKFDVLLTKVDKKTIKILEQVSSFVPFSEICETQYGCATGDNDVWLRDKTKNISRKQWLDKNAKIFGTVRDKDGEEKVNTNLKDYYKGQHISRYYLHKTQYEVNYLPDKMKKHRTTARPGDIDDRFEKEKIVMSLIGEKMKCVFDRKNCYFDVNANILTIKKEQIEKYSYQYLAACLNSKILNFIANLFRSNISFTSSLLKKLTIPPAPLETQREIAEWVRKLTDLYEIYYTQKDTWTPETLKTEEARLVRVEYEIDKRVCEFYGVDYEDL